MYMLRSLRATSHHIHNFEFEKFEANVSEAHFRTSPHNLWLILPDFEGVLSDLTFPDLRGIEPTPKGFFSIIF